MAKKQVTCELCVREGRAKTNDAAWAWQPFGPDKQPSYTLLGSHYRGFQVIKICDEHKAITGASFKAGAVLFGD
jgi:hypothetical protein